MDPSLDFILWRSCECPASYRVLLRLRLCRCSSVMFIAQIGFMCCVLVCVAFGLHLAQALQRRTDRLSVRSEQICGDLSSAVRLHPIMGLSPAGRMIRSDCLSQSYVENFT